MDLGVDPTRQPTLLFKLTLTLGSLIASLAAAELLASTVHRDAFPYLNLFEADATYGVRLIPHATTRVRSREGRITEISTNARGFRGPQWHPSTTTAPVLLLGDSQMFGFGVPYAQSTAALLEQSLGVPVLCAAVPSWGPAEYVAAVSDLGPSFRPRDVVFVANAANDWFETVPNTRRTTARDGWAAHAQAPLPAAFPFRQFLLGRSHLVLAVRQLTHHLGDGEVAPTQSARLLRRDAALPKKPSHLIASLRAAVKACAPVGCRVTAVALPLDVQVDAAEWKKYRSAPEDMRASEVLLEDFVTDARALGLTAVNLLPVLRAAEPGAFLPDDYHLSPQGHRAVAQALSDVLLRRPAGSPVASSEVNR